jgi:TonB family protein
VEIRLAIGGMKASNPNMKFALLLLISVTGIWAQGGGYGKQDLLQQVGSPKLVQRVAHEYTTEALAAKVEDSVYLSTVIGIDGLPSEIKVIKTLDQGLDAKAIECLKKWRFSPAMRNVEPVPMSSEVEIVFQLPPTSK